MKILVLSPYLPHRRVGHGGGTAVRDLVSWLARDHQVSLAAMVRPHELDLVTEVEALGAEVWGLPFLDDRAAGVDRLALAAARGRACLRSVRSGYPLYVEKYWSRDHSRRILEGVRDFHPDAVQIEYLQMSLYCRDLQAWRRRGNCSLPRLVLNSHELGSLPRQRRALRTANPFERLALRSEAARWRRLQVAASGWADRTLCVTPEDHALYAAMGGRNLEVVPLGMDTERIQPDWDPRDPERHLFLGSFGHRPNVVAAEFLTEVVWPAVRRQRPQAGLLLAGRGSQEFLSGRGSPSRWAQQGVAALGYVEDLAPLFRECRLFLAPLPEGGGIKIKILEAMARGVPVVTSPVGAEGILQARDADAAMVVRPCDDSFAPAVLAAAADPEGCRRRAARARALIEDGFSWRAITGRLARIYAGDDGPKS